MYLICIVEFSFPVVLFSKEEMKQQTWDCILITRQGNAI